MTLKELRLENNISQLKASMILGIPERTYRRYESEETYGSDFKRRIFLQILSDYFEITEEKGLLTIEQIKERVARLFDEEYAGHIDLCILFGSYAKGLANEHSDVDLYVSSSLKGLRFVGLIEKLRQVLHKKVDLIRSSELKDNVELIDEIMKGGIKIYG